MDNVLVIGKSGQLARSLQSLISTNDSVQFKSKEELDITDYSSINKLFRANRPNVVINCAGYTNVELAEREETEATRINFGGVKNLVKACNEFNIKLIHISTDYVFDGNSKAPYKETDVTAALNSYGKSKAKSDSYIAKHCNHFLIVRTAWLFSPFGHNFLKTIVNKLQQESSIKVVADQIGSPTSSVSLAHFLLWLVNQGSITNQLINFTDIGSGSWYDMAKIIAEQLTVYTNKKYTVADISTDNFNLNAKRPKYSVLSTGLLDSLNYNQRKTWQDALKEHIEEIIYSRNNNGNSSTTT